MWVRFLMLGSKISISSWWKSWKVRCLYWGTISKLSTFFISTWHYKESKYLNRTRYIWRTELKYLLVKLNERQFKSVALSLIESYSEQFIMKSRSIPTISDLFDPSNFDLSHPELQEKCENIDLTISESQVELIEQDTREQAKGNAFSSTELGTLVHLLVGQ